MSTFRLQQFSVEQNRSGMKVCSDSLLFGAMIPLTGAQRILDIGTGTGLLALMQAQKAKALKINATLTAIELTPEAATEAANNVKASSWSNAIYVIQQDIQSFAQHQATLRFSVDVKESALAQPYDLIISNPPFFIDHSRTQGEQELRSIARHTDTLSYEQLCEAMSSLLAVNGVAYVLIPTMAINTFSQAAHTFKLVVANITHIAESLKHEAKVSVLRLIHIEKNNKDQAKKNHDYKRIRTLYKFDDNKIHTAEVKAYLMPFLLRYAKEPVVKDR